VVEVVVGCEWYACDYFVGGGVGDVVMTFGGLFVGVPVDLVV